MSSRNKQQPKILKPTEPQSDDEEQTADPMLQRTHKLVSKHKVRVDPSFNKLIVALRTATAKGEWDLDKTSSNSLYTDVLDAFMLSVMPIQFRSSK